MNFVTSDEIIGTTHRPGIDIHATFSLVAGFAVVTPFRVTPG